MIRIGSIYIQRSLLNSNALHPPRAVPPNLGEVHIV